jgi:hypothetical protein
VRTRHAVVLGAALAAALSVPAQAAAPRDVVTRWQAGDWTIWRIDRPTADHAATTFHDIVLRPGDRVAIDAGGCLRLADGRWAELAGEGESALLVDLPGVTRGPVPARGLLRTTMEVGEDGGVLRLGFAGPRLRGNGYEGLKAGACAGQPDGFVMVGVQATLTVYPPMNLVWSAADHNGIPLNPRWGQQANYPGTVPDPVAICFSVPGWFQNPVCTTQRPTYDTATWFKALICEIGATTPLAGHVNWYPSTYEGPIYWSSHEWSDDDYNMNVVPPNRNGLVASSGSTLHTEFDGSETVENFTTPWWSSFRQAVDSSDALARSMVDGRPAIVSGLAGLDCEHDCYTEIHPVWLMAIRVRSDSTKDVWAIFARNWGNEGYCSRYQHHLLLSGNQYKVSLPWRGGATGVNVAGTQFKANVSGLSWWWGTTFGQKVNVTFQLPAPDAHGRIHGEMVLNWSGPVMQAADADVALAAAARPEDEPRGNTGEALVSGLMKALTPAQRRAFERRAGKGGRGGDGIAALSGGRRAPAETAAAAAPAPGVRSVIDTAREKKDKRTLEALREAYGGVLPGAVGEALRKAGEPEAPPKE